jgi:transposase
MEHDSMICAGVDVSKTKLDVVIYPGKQHLTVPYTPEGLEKMDAFLALHRVRRVGFEASGGYEWQLLAHLRKGPLEAARFQPFQIRAFARSKLRRAKNDRLDGGVIGEFTACQTELPPLPDAGMDGWAGHLTYIEQIEDQIMTLKTMLETTRDKRIVSCRVREIESLERRRLAEIALLTKRICANAAIKRRMDLLVSIKGVGARTALAMLVRMPELGAMTRGQAAAMAGLAPYDDDSGTRKGARHVMGGRARLRKSLFMSGFVSSRWNPDLAAFYKRLRQNGKCHLTATIATTRKLVILANAILQRATPWQPQKLKC